MKTVSGDRREGTPVMRTLRRYTNGLAFALRNRKALRTAMGYAWREVRRNELCLYANAYGSDKGLGGHNYTRLYLKLFEPIRYQVRHLLEIGLLREKIQRRKHGPVMTDAPSLRMWSRYFPHANILGFDIADFSDFAFERCTTLQGDQSCRNDLARIREWLNDELLDIVIDDGLHASRHQQISFGTIFPLVKSKGYYIIEDLNYQPNSAEEECDQKTAALLKAFLQTNKFSSPHLSDAENAYLSEHIRQIFVCDSLEPAYVGEISLAVIQKK
jgi:hypothetical protein